MTLRVFLAGAGTEGVNWAFDENQRLTALALQGFAESTSRLADAHLVHAMWWGAVTALPPHALNGKRVLAYTNDDVYLRILGDPAYLGARRFVALWLARNSREMTEYRTLRMRSAFVPRIIDLDVFRPRSRDDDDLGELRARYRIPSDRYLIGNFQRDTLGKDLDAPKLKKGPDIFAEITIALLSRGFPVHVVLGGPRRHWIRRRLAGAGVPFTYVGEVLDGDDIAVNVLPRPVLNTLYNLVDVSVVSSRDEGHPAAVTESAAAGCKIVSTPVGIAPDLLEAECLYRSVDDAVNLIAADIERDALRPTIAVHRERVCARHSVAAVAPALRDIYDAAMALPAIVVNANPVRRVRREGRRGVRFVRRLLGMPRRPGAGLVVSMWNRFFAPPYGGANQFMRALGVALRARGVTVVENSAAGVDVHLLQADGFDVKRFRRHFRRESPRVIHRLDGPTVLYRGFGRENDEAVFALNRECATASVVQSVWSLERTAEMGYVPIDPVLIFNAADPAIFYRSPAPAWDGGRKLRLVSTSWSDNPAKGVAVYKFLDEHLDWTRFEYTFIGRIQQTFRNIRVIAPLPTEALANALRGHDAYVTASQNDPCSNALVEALTCGLPAVYRRDGGHPELVGLGGVGFVDEGDVLSAVEKLVDSFERYRRLVAPPRMDDVADQYLTLIHQVKDGEWVTSKPIDNDAPVAFPS